MFDVTSYNKQGKFNLCFTYKWRKNFGGGDFDVERSTLQKEKCYFYIAIRIYCTRKGVCHYL